MIHSFRSENIYLIVVFYPYSKVHLNFEYVKRKVSFEIYYPRGGKQEI